MGRGRRTRAARPAALLAALLAGFAAGSAWAAPQAEPLQPYQLVRSLQLVQDRIAAGDHAALPMQAKLLELADARFRAAGREDSGAAQPARPAGLWHERRQTGDHRGGGGRVGWMPATARRRRQRPLLAAIHRRHGGLARRGPDEPAADRRLRRVGQGLVLRTTNPRRNCPVRPGELLSPGTLVEEAALRRSHRIAAARGEADRYP